MKHIALKLILLLFPTLLFAQTEKSYVINAGGGSVQSGNISVTYFIGDFIGLGGSRLETQVGAIDFYPSPVKSTLYINSEIPDMDNIKIFNLNGVLLSETKITNNEVNFSMYTSGVYLLKIYDKNESEVGSVKVIKQ